MAFVPKVHNRAVPIANRHVHYRSQRTHQERHINTLDSIKPRIENRWGTTHNGVKEQKQPTYSHLGANSKKAQLQDERYAQIELENYRLLEKLSKILVRSHDPTLGTREWGAGVRLDSNMMPVIDHAVAAQSNEFGAAIQPTSLNLGYRRQQQERINSENKQLVKRLQMCRPTYENAKYERDAREREEWQAAHPRVRVYGAIGGGGGRRSRPQSAPVGRSSNASSTQWAGGPSAGRGDTSFRRARPSTAFVRNRKPGAPEGKPTPDQTVGKVLELLSAQMAGARTLAEMREARDSLMANELRKLEGFELREISSEGVQMEVVQPEGYVPPESGEETIVILVHGGMFVTGSPRGVRHLAVRLALELQVPVATPALRLAPEHRYPAPSDDLRAAYLRVSQRGVAEDTCAGAAAAESNSARSRRIALIAESSGCSLALSLVRSILNDEGSDLRAPQAMVLLSPWLDLACTGGSYTINQGCDPVMQRDKLLNLSQTYRNGLIDSNDPAVSPVLAPAEAFARLPPTLVHVGETEVVLDDALRLQSLSAAVTLREYKDVLHAWHAFFPIMPKADEALAQVIEFIRATLNLQQPQQPQQPQPQQERNGNAEPGESLLGSDFSLGELMAPVPEA